MHPTFQAPEPASTPSKNPVNLDKAGAQALRCALDLLCGRVSGLVNDESLSSFPAINASHFIGAPAPSRGYVPPGECNIAGLGLISGRQLNSVQTDKGEMNDFAKSY
jgi:hypothetical protein